MACGCGNMVPGTISKKLRPMQTPFTSTSDQVTLIDAQVGPIDPHPHPHSNNSQAVRILVDPNPAHTQVSDSDSKVMDTSSNGTGRHCLWAGSWRGSSATDLSSS